MTLILYESPQRLIKTLEDLRKYWGNRSIAVARELTKHYEEIFRGTIEEAIDHFSGGTKGEFTLVIAGAEVEDLGAGEKSESDTSEASWQTELAQLLKEVQMSVKEASEQIARRHGLQKRMVYQEALKLKEK